MYHISETIKILPTVCWVLLGSLTLFMEVRIFAEQLTLQPQPVPGRDGFIQPPGQGYEYFVSAQNIVYLRQKSKRVYHVYVVKGEPPASVSIKKDKFGRYFSLRANTTSEAESIIDQAYNL